jgi:hypothetical protein
MAEPAWRRAGFATPNAYVKANRESAAWSRRSSQSPTSAWDPRFTPEQKGAYYRAFASPSTGVAAYAKRNHREGEADKGSKWLRRFLVEETDRVTEGQWRERYKGLE